MFLDSLQFAVLRILEDRSLTYEKAAELCDLSSRYIGDIARRRTSPSTLTLEKICIGFGKTPNELLLSGHNLMFADSLIDVSCKCCPCKNAERCQKLLSFCQKCSASLHKDI